MSIKHIIKPKEKDLGGFSVRRLLPFLNQKMVGPWIFFDHMGPAEFESGTGIDVRPHPHINLATVTYLFEGEILHRDSLGSFQAIKPGDINLMVAGKGITHSERERDEVRSQDHHIHGLQLWHALPEEYEEIDPAFYHYPANEIPSVVENDVKIRVMMGDAYGVKSPVKTFADTIYIEADMKSGQFLLTPKSEQLAIYVVNGEIEIAGNKIEQYSMAILADNSSCDIKASKNSRIAIIGGQAFTKRYIEWNFVSSSKDRIAKAKKDWQEGNFPKVTGDEKEFIPLP